MTDLLPTPVHASPLEKVEAALSAAGWHRDDVKSSRMDLSYWESGSGRDRRAMCVWVDTELGMLRYGNGESWTDRVMAELGFTLTDMMYPKEAFPNGRLIAEMERGQPLQTGQLSVVLGRSISSIAAANPVWAEVRKVLAAAMTGDVGLIGTAVGEMMVNAPDLAEWAQEDWFVAGIDDPEPPTTCC